jgi:hypothetical protein
VHRTRKIAQLARRETTPEGYAHYQPVTRGPVVAVLGIAAIGLCIPFYWVGRFLRGIGARNRKR